MAAAAGALTATLVTRPAFDPGLPALGRPRDRPAAGGTPPARAPPPGLVAASCGFHGGRVFPSVSIGAALGLCAHALVPAVHPSVCVAAGVLGLLLAVTRYGWVSLFTATVPAPSPTVPDQLCTASPPAWLLFTGRLQMRLQEDVTAIRRDGTAIRRRDREPLIRCTDRGESRRADGPRADEQTDREPMHGRGDASPMRRPGGK
ncbi:hypothetical protein [Streptomyces glomeratus]|uniref:SLC26A/SulP transporter domain-containing protein n=1 Tax=Streptomyces glomeratus TaxID=284452 RepID=A0ABP6LD09_9ACTN